MIQNSPKIEASIPIYNKAREKYDNCKHTVNFNGQLSCNLFFYTYDNASDILHHCSSCKLNTKEPTTSKHNVRFG